MSTSIPSTLAAATGPTGAAGFFIQMFPFLIIGLIMYMLIIRPQSRRLKEHQSKIAAVKKGDDVVTGGGLRGRVTKVSDDEVEVEIAQGVRVRAIKSTLTDIGKPAAKPAND